METPRASPGSLLDDIVEEIDSSAATTARPAMRPLTICSGSYGKGYARI